MADLLIRDLSNEAVTRLNSFAKEKGVSRNEFIRDHLETLSFSDELRKFEADYKLTVDKILRVININTRVLSAISEELLIDIDSIVREEY